MATSLSYFNKVPYNIAVIGAASGIGRAAAQLMAGQGASLYCLDRNAEGARKCAEEIRAGNGNAEWDGIEVADEVSAHKTLAKIIAQSGELHAVLNCAGMTGRTNIKAHEVDLAEFDLVYRVNLRGAFVISQAVLPHMMANGYGRILHVASIAGKDGNAGMTAYSATKAGLIGLVKTMAKDYAESGVTINALAPAVIRTPMVDALPEATIKYMTDKIPMRRCGELAEAAQMIAWILSPACSFTTGFTFDLTGGRATY